MTRFLKLVRHQDGKWKALPTDTDDLSQVSLKERTYAPIDPSQLLKALDSLLSPDGGIKSTEDVKKIASLMKKFSKKLVSRCVYCNVLQATKPEILSDYLEEGGWDTINIWLQYAKSSASHSFLLEMLKLCRQLPMTVTRLKENNTAKLIKSLTKHENAEVKTISSELVNKWMMIIKGKKSAELSSGEKKKKKVKPSKEDDSKMEAKASPKRANHKLVKEKVSNEKPVSDKPVNDKDISEKPTGKSESELIRTISRLKGTKRTSTDKEQKKTEYYEDVKIDIDQLYPIPKKPRPDRPKTAKVYQKNFRSTGLEEETPLPKNISKKTATVDKTAVAAAKSALTKMTAPIVPDRILDKKIKPESLLAVNESANSNKGIKLIPAKPRPVLQESASFMDALCPQPGPPLKRKKKAQPNKPNASPTSPTSTPPKLQFYKDTLELNEEKKEESPEKEDSVTSEEKSDDQPIAENVDQADVDEMKEDGSNTPPNTENIISSSPKGYSDETEEESTEKPPFDPDQLRSILSHGRRRGKKKSVQWVEDNNLKEIFYFELDETERVNVLRAQTFCDLKSIEAKREREAMELVKRQAGDRMEEAIRWWQFPILIDCPPALMEPGCQSKEKEIERLRQQSSLQEIYFTREMIPDSPREPDLEIVPTIEPKVIPLDEENQIGTVMDYSKFETPKASLPDVLTSLIMNTSKPLPSAPSSFSPEQMPFDASNLKLPLLDANKVLNQMPIAPMSASYDPAEPITSNCLLPHPPMPNMMVMPPGNENQNMGNIRPPPEWRPNEDMDMNPMKPPDGFFRNFNMNAGLPMDPMSGMNMRPRMMPDMFRPPVMPKGPRGPRPRPRVLCRHFAAGSCRFGNNCTFLHPGVNGPLM
ncbi:serine/threonine-protein phosphatase 1 regulatory subunit 10-like isoform X2 [Uloborus diversus]|uniref:serine/threonine-protein phosphatase 1 regulatory subunit 10-like isoform X2 n=1 Tax=Uloborus diversus TaxID=327109 RepID=UPI00240A1C34|nr:serine/threonine-protein phosphatase 1 regulatory subunit 10-like isoform X2 [Uloborus diversus]